MEPDKMSKEQRKVYVDNVASSVMKKIVIAIVDILLVFLVNVLVTYIANYGVVLPSSYGSNLLFDYRHCIFLCVVTVGLNLAFGLYQSVWRYASVDEVVRCIVSSAITTLMLFLYDRVLYVCLLNGNANDRIGFPAYIFFFIFEIIALAIPRISFRFLRNTVDTFSYFKNRNVKRIMIVGAGFMGNFIIETLRNESFKTGRPIIAVDDNPQKLKSRINHIKVVGNTSQIPVLVEKYRIDEIIICVPSASNQRQKEILDIAISTGVKVKLSPSIEDMMSQDGRKRIRNVDISDLLFRPEVKLDKKVCKYLINKTILVTGGGGSIGSEICMQVARYNPSAIIIFDIYENCAFELANELNKRYKDEIDIYVRIGSVRDKSRLREVCREFHPDVIFHAAAHKHVPLMEDSPCEAVKNNVFGTYNVALIADEFKVPKMVILSTDKAVNPTNVMGCTKRLTEIIIQHMNAKSKYTRYAAVRFGNVLGSHGSVIPIFKKQIEEGGPVTVTHPDITRYFMTIPEAAQLVCQAGGLAKGGEVFVLDMGEPIKIIDLARNLIKLSGYTEEEIPIKIVGLRPGEKLYEELAMESELETRKKTANEKIYVTQPMDIDDKKFDEMMNSLRHISVGNVRRKLMKYVPNYTPNLNDNKIDS